MKQSETLKVLSVLKVAYPQFYAKQNTQDLQSTVSLWNEMFKDDSYEDVIGAVKGVIATDVTGFPPTIGIVRQMMRKLANPQADTSVDAWTLVRKAISRGLYGSKEQFEKLPERAKRVVGGASQLHDWALMDSATVDSVVQSNFLRSYRAIESQENEMKMLPSVAMIEERKERLLSETLG